MLHQVSVSGMKVSNHPEDILITYSLGSCLGLTLYDPAVRVGGMIHCMLPLSKIDKIKAQATPAMFVDTGIPALLQAMYDLGARKSRLLVNVAGCASLLDDKKLFRIGERNRTVLRKVLWKNDIMIASEDCGGTVSRTLILYIANGRTTVKSLGKVRVL